MRLPTNTAWTTLVSNLLLLLWQLPAAGAAATQLLTRSTAGSNMQYTCMPLEPTVAYARHDGFRSNSLHAYALFLSMVVCQRGAAAIAWLAQSSYTGGCIRQS